MAIATLSRTRVLNFGLASFLIVLTALVGLWSWAV
jgi:hypothetical protein